MKNRVGEIFTTNEGYKVEIIEYLNHKYCTVKFEDGQQVKDLKYCNIKNGQVKNMNHKSVYNTGFIGYGRFKTKINYKTTKSYSLWSDMFTRCYTFGFKEKHPTYSNCSVHDDWHNYQNFADWFDKNYIDGFQLDKDILIKGNKLYSSDTCCFVPPEINTVFGKRDSKRGIYPIGVTTRKGKLVAHMHKGDKTVDFGYFNSLEQAFQAYKEAKEEHIKELAEKWKNQISEQCYKALINYKVEITD